MAEGCEDSAGAAESTTSQSQYTTLDKMLGTVLPCEAAIGATPGGGSSSGNSSSNIGGNIVKREFCDGSLMPGAGASVNNNNANATNNNNNNSSSSNNNNNNNNTKMQAMICNKSSSANNSSSSSSSSSSCSSSSSSSSSATSTLTSCTTAAVVPSNCSTNANKSPVSPYSQSLGMAIGIGAGAGSSPLREASPLPSSRSPLNAIASTIAAKSPCSGAAPASPPSASSNSSSHVLALNIKTESVSRTALLNPCITHFRLSNCSNSGQNKTESA
ncbi:GD15370 [Drosophila simulans]|uniref:GD15370 n=1 Tax=Drosophila simulans TaxID=7240 RepID=B4NS89_DROSI|nr:GD15370 [Drosophila simulans]